MNNTQMMGYFAGYMQKQAAKDSQDTEKPTDVKTPSVDELAPKETPKAVEPPKAVPAAPAKSIDELSGRMRTPLIRNVLGLIAQHRKAYGK